MTEPLLEIRELSVHLDGLAPVGVVDRVSLSIAHGETLALVGESGCGKSVTALSILRLLDAPLAIAGGEIRFEGVDLLGLSQRELRRIRGRRIAMIFQEPMTALNPVLTVGEQVAEGLRLHRGLSRRAAHQRAIELIHEVGIPDAASRVGSFPHQLSGGMRQRVMIAMALACDPDLLIADEPTTALDVTIQAQILALLARLQRERGMSLLLITHDLGVVRDVAQRVIVMYAGRVVEQADVASLFARPQHPYTVGLLRSVPSLGDGVGRLPSIDGVVPSPEHFPHGCRFHPRCPERLDRCAQEVPVMRPVGAAQQAACHARAPWSGA